MKPSLTLRLVAWLTRRRIVWMRHFDGEVRFSMERTTPWGRVAYVYPLAKIGHVVLHDDGTTGGSAIYVSKWAYWENDR